MGKFLVTESEKNDIRKMYGLIKEQGITLPITVTDSYTAADCDELHAFQSTSGKIIGNMNVTVGNKLQEIYNSGVNPKVTNVKVEVKGMTVTWTVTINKSDDKKAWVGFTSRGAGCNNDIINRAESVSYGNDVGTAKTNIESKYGEKGIEIEKVNDFIYNGGKNSFRQVFYRYTKPTNNPPKSDQQQNTQQSTQQPINITAKDINDLSTQIKTQTQNKSFDFDTIDADLDNFTFSIEPGETKVFKLVLTFNTPEDQKNNIFPSYTNVISKNPTYSPKPVLSGDFENSTRKYSIIALYPPK